MDVLRQKVWERLRGKYQQAEAILLEAEAGDKHAIESVSKLLDRGGGWWKCCAAAS